MMHDPVDARETSMGTVRLRDQLGRGRATSDALFTDVGARLQGCAGVLNDITAAVEALPRELQGGEMIDATAHLSGLGDQAAAITTAFVRERDSLAELLCVVAAVSGPVQDLDKTARLLGILALNAHVVAADSNSRETGLTTIAQEATRLSDHAAERIKIFRTAYRRLGETVQQAAHQQAAFEANHRRSLTDLAAGIGRKLDELEQHRTQSAGALEETARLTRDVSQGITQAVMALQIGDATHQRLEHIEKALVIAENLRDDGNAVAGEVLLLQQRQLDDAATRFDNEDRALKDALGQLAQRAGAIVQQGKAIGRESGGQQEGSVLASLSAEMRAAGAVLRTYERERRKLDAMAGTVSSTVHALLGEVDTVRRIERSMRLLSLNATARCDQQDLAAGGFDVIAQQLRDITLRLVGCANGAVGGLERAATLAQTFIESSSSAGADRVGDMEAQAAQAITLLEGVEARLEAALAALDGQGPHAVRGLEMAAAEFANSQAVSHLMAGAAAELGADPTVQLAALASGHGEGEAADTFAALRRAYTMAVERQVHDAFVSGSTVDAAAADGIAPAASDDEVLFF
jgi:hypothetical protein